MGYYVDDHPRHGHRTPAEIAEDDTFAALRGDYCGVFQPADTNPTSFADPCLVPRQRALVRLADRLQQGDRHEH